MVEKASVFGIFKKIFGVDLPENSFTASKMLWLHFFIGGSYALLQKLARGISKISGGDLKFDTMPQVRTFWTIFLWERSKYTQIQRVLR